MLGGILDGGSSARFAQNLQRGSEIAIGVSAGYDAFDRLEGQFTLSGTPKPEITLEKLQEAIESQIDRLKQEKVSDKELARVKAQVVSGRVYQQDSMFGMAMQIGLLETAGHRLATHRRLLRTYSAGECRGYPARGTALFQVRESDPGQVLAGGVSTMRSGLLLLLCLTFLPVYAVDIQHWKTASGVPVYFIESHDLPIVDIRLSFRAASSRDGDLPGIAGLVNGLLVEGTGKLSAQDIALEFEQVGAQLGHSANRDMAWTSLRSLSERGKLDAIVDLFARVTALPEFSQTALDRDREALLVNLASRQKQIAALTSDRFRQAMYRDHPYQYGSHGLAKVLQAITLEDVFGFSSTLLCCQ